MLNLRNLRKFVLWVFNFKCIRCGYTIRCGTFVDMLALVCEQPGWFQRFRVKFSSYYYFLTSFFSLEFINYKFCLYRSNMFFFICITFLLNHIWKICAKIRNISIKGFLRVLDICCCSVCIERGSHVVSVLINCVIFAISVRFYFMFFV